MLLRVLFFLVGLMYGCSCHASGSRLGADLPSGFIFLNLSFAIVFLIKIIRGAHSPELVLEGFLTDKRGFLIKARDSEICVRSVRLGGGLFQFGESNTHLLDLFISHPFGGARDDASTSLSQHFSRRALGDGGPDIAESAE